MFASCLLALATTGCANRLFFQPNRVVYQTPSDKQLPYEAVRFASLDGTSLSGWFIPARGNARGNARGTVVHLHGNAQNMTAHYGYVDWLPAAGYNLFVFDYRGYGISEGRPSRHGLYEDSVAALRTVAARPDVNGQRILVIGQSLGGANAIAALARHEIPGIRAIVIESTFASYRAIVRDKIAMIPLLSLLRWPLSFVVVSNGYSPDAGIARLPPVPVLFIHGTDDTIIPYTHGERLFARAREPKTLWSVEGGNHTEAFSRFRNTYAPRLLEFFDTALAMPANTDTID